MADNVEITAGSGTVIAADEVGTTYYQRIKLDAGGDGLSVPVVAGQQTKAASLPVTLASDQGDLPVTLDGETVALSGDLPDTAAGDLAAIVAALSATLTVRAAVPTGAPLAGQLEIAVTGTAIQLAAVATPLPGGLVIVGAAADNAASGTAGATGLSEEVNGTGNGAIVIAGATVPLFADDLADCWVNGEAGDIFWWSAG